MMTRLSALLALFVAASALASAQSYKPRALSLLGGALQEIEAGIAAQRKAGHRSYNPEYVFVVNPATQRMHVLSRPKGDVMVTVKCGTGKRGLGFDDSQTPPGFYTMGGVRIATNASYKIQTGDTKKGVSGIYAELLYPPSHADPKLRGRVPNNVVIHTYNPEASAMLKERKARGLIGKVPCTTGCPVPETHEAKKLVPYLKAGAGKFDPEARPNAALRSLITKGKVKEYSRNGLGAAIFVIGR